jgi:NitT/TauT family transport system substrate-binding protein
MIAALQHHKILCGMTTQPTVAALEKLGVAYPAFDLTTTAGVKQWLGGFTPTAGVLALTSWVDSNKDTVQKVVDAIVATMHWISTHTAADIANALPPSFVNNALVTKATYISTLSTDKTQFLPDGVMPASGPTVIMAISKLAGVITGPVDLSTTYTNSYRTRTRRSASPPRADPRAPLDDLPPARHPRAGGSPRQDVTFERENAPPVVRAGWRGRDDRGRSRWLRVA